jgi:hypothetical protein
MLLYTRLSFQVVKNRKGADDSEYNEDVQNTPYKSIDIG